MQSADQQLLSAIENLLAGEEDTLSIPLSKINQGIAQLVTQNEKLVTKLQGKVIKDINRHLTHQDNAIDGLSTTVLSGLQAWQDSTHLLLTQLAAKSGLTGPGDPLEQALVEQVAEAPELAYSAALLIALREAMGRFDGLVEVLREIRDRIGGEPVRFAAEQPAVDELEVVIGEPGEPILADPVTEGPW